MLTNSWREAFAPQIAAVIAAAKTGCWSTTMLRRVLKQGRPSYPSTSHQYKIWGSEQARQIRRHVAGLPPVSFSPRARKPIAQPKGQQSLF